MQTTSSCLERPVRIPIGTGTLGGIFCVPDGVQSLVLFAHGSGSGRHSARNRHVAHHLQQAGIGTLLIDLLTAQEEVVDARAGYATTNIEHLAKRLLDVTEWLRQQPETSTLRLGYFGSSTGGGAALLAASRIPHEIGAVVTRGGRPDLAGAALAKLQAPTLLIVGGMDLPAIRLNEVALEKINADRDLVIVPGAGRLFEEPGTLDQVAHLASDWFRSYLMSQELSKVV